VIPSIRTFCIPGLIVIVAITGCDPAVRISGSVRDAEGGAIGGAAVHLECLAARLSVTRDATTAADGKFLMAGVGCVPLQCQLTVQGTEVESTPVVLRGHCSQRYGPCGAETCNVADVTLTVRPPPSRVPP
jgi:hypothetical protein